ncbi:hypothetical protein B0H14DRAFT_3639937 [Mycena olivaceomarginata]|nr:hypothetical protein B0H14DRAFT_3639937 [Mycena olivaceomarginata]
MRVMDPKIWEEEKSGKKPLTVETSDFGVSNLRARSGKSSNQSSMNGGSSAVMLLGRGGGDGHEGEGEANDEPPSARSRRVPLRASGSTATSEYKSHILGVGVMKTVKGNPKANRSLSAAGAAAPTRAARRNANVAPASDKESQMSGLPDSLYRNLRVVKIWFNTTGAAFWDFDQSFGKKGRNFKYGPSMGMMAVDKDKIGPRFAPAGVELVRGDVKTSSNLKS